MTGGRLVAPALLAAAVLLAGCSGSPTPVTSVAVAPTTPWEPAQPLPSPAPPAHSVVAQTPDGGGIAAWPVRLDGGRGRVLVAERDRDGRWSAGRPVIPVSPFTVRGAAVAVDRAGVATVVWALDDRPSGAIFSYVQTARRAPGGRWSEPVTLSRGTNGLVAPVVAAQADGRVVVAWSGSTRRNGSYFGEVRSASRAPGGRWRTARVAGYLLGDPLSGTEAIAAGNGRTRLAWQSFPRRGDPGGVFAASRRADGRWTRPQRLTRREESPREMRSAVAPHGRMALAWSSKNYRGSIRAAVAGPSAGWSRPRAVSPRRGHNLPLALAIADRGPALLVYENQRGPVRTGLRAVRIGRSGAGTATLLARRRPAPQTAGTRLAAFIGASAAVDANGRGLVSWPSYASGPGDVDRIRAFRARVGEASAWRSEETVVAFAASAATQSSVPRAEARGRRFVLRWDEVAVGGRRRALSATRRP